MGKVRFQLSDRNLVALRDAVQAPYHIRKLAQKCLDERAQITRYKEMAK